MRNFKSFSRDYTPDPDSKTGEGEGGKGKEEGEERDMQEGEENVDRPTQCSVPIVSASLLHCSIENVNGD